MKKTYIAPWEDPRLKNRSKAHRWAASIVFLIVIPFQIILDLFRDLGDAGLLDSETRSKNSYQAYNPDTSDWYNFDGTQNMDGDKNTGK